MAYCANCGNPLADSQKFCPVCGRQAGGGASASPGGGAASGAAPQGEYAAPQADYGVSQRPSRQGPPPGYQPGWTYYDQSPSAAPPRRGRKGLWIGLVVALLVVVVACVLVFLVFRGAIFGGAASSPEAAVRSFLSAFEDKNVDAVFDLLDPEAMSEQLDGQTVSEAKAAMRAALFEQEGVDSIRFSDIDMKTDETGAGTAVVTLTAGKVIITGEDGDEEVFDVSEADSPPTIDLVKRDGSWYLDPGSMSFLSGGGDSGGGTTTTDTTDMGPPTTVPGSTSTTLFTTPGGGSGAKTPQEVVMRFFEAMENKDAAALIALFDPVALEELREGVSIDLFVEMMGESLFDYESMDFSGIEVDVEFQDDATATVTVVEGTVTITDFEGYTTTEDVREADEPAIINVIKRDGYWYADPKALFGSTV